ATRGWRHPKKMRPRTATQTGIIAIRTPVMPDGTVCSPHATRPMPPPMRSVPMMKLSRPSRRVGISTAPRRRIATAASITRPAMANRDAARTNGGIVSTATRIPRYVDPQTTYRIRIAAQTRTGEVGRAALEAVGSGSGVGIVGWSKVRAVYDIARPGGKARDRWRRAVSGRQRPAVLARPVAGLRRIPRRRELDEVPLGDPSRVVA